VQKKNTIDGEVNRGLPDVNKTCFTMVCTETSRVESLFLTEHVVVRMRTNRVQRVNNITTHCCVAIVFLKTLLAINQVISWI